jgi:ABC-type nitrate/sulfonate/bicarbonate transport system substrate-binding protein
VKRARFAQSLVSFAVAAGVAVKPAFAETQRNGAITIGLVPALRPLNMVRALGSLERAGIPVKWVEFETVPPLATAMVSGAVDMGEADIRDFAVLEGARRRLVRRIGHRELRGFRGAQWHEDREGRRP